MELSLRSLVRERHFRLSAQYEMTSDLESLFVLPLPTDLQTDGTEIRYYFCVGFNDRFGWTTYRNVVEVPYAKWSPECVGDVIDGEFKQ